MGTPAGGTSPAARESLIRDGDGSRVWVLLARAFPADPCCSPGRGFFLQVGPAKPSPCFHAVGTLQARHLQKGRSHPSISGKAPALGEWSGELQGQKAPLKHHLHSQSSYPHPLALSAPGSPEFD